MVGGTEEFTKSAGSCCSCCRVVEGSCGGNRVASVPEVIGRPWIS